MAHKEYTTPLGKKLGIKEGFRVALIGAPDGFERALEPLPPGVQIAPAARGTKDVIVFFSVRQADFDKRFAALAKRLDPAGGLWVAYPKKASGVETDVTFESAQATGLAAGLVDNKSIAVDETWSGVRFVYRLKDRQA